MLGAMPASWATYLGLRFVRRRISGLAPAGASPPWQMGLTKCTRSHKAFACGFLADIAFGLMA
ncbi:hypothetical protein L917_18950 [Phytophthora nicotianae]|uniref:Uncharacterized protein n=2 Tax=Phytophthora nicotianae TaxID=4792 RepID=W2K819_PHYNI|nr:hypothetical protein L917_18951 [Phytophthora nicotianae]ETL80564.1 hypothetical protein L917_18950 [Phytophthora nicotianae]ETO62307.1 hypothetical protein F444_19763 [Phytophthora nicotianae P1976]